MVNKFKSESKKFFNTLWFYCAPVGIFFKVTDMVIRHLFSGHHGIEIEIANGFFYCVSRKWQSAVFATKNLLLKHWHFGPPTPIYFVAVEKWPKLLCHLYLLVNGFLIGHMSLDGFFGEINTQSFWIEMSGLQTYPKSLRVQLNEYQTDLQIFLN